MSKWKTSGVIALFVLGAGLVGYGIAQTRQTESKAVLISIPCYKDAAALSFLLFREYGEEPLAESVSSMNWLDSGGKVKEMIGTSIMFANHETKSYSNVLVFKDGSACLINSGIEFSPIRRQEYN